MKNKHNIYCILLMLFILVFNMESVLAKVGVNDRQDTIYISVNFKPEEKAMFFYQDEYGNTIAPFQLIGKSLKKIAVNGPLLLIDAKNQIPYLLFPKEQLILKKVNGANNFIVSGNPERSKDLIFFESFVKSQGTLFAPALLGQGGKGQAVLGNNFNMKEYMNFVRSRYQARRNYLAANKAGLSAAHFSYTEKMIGYLYLQDQLWISTVKALDLKTLDKAYIKQLLHLKNEFTADEDLENFGYRQALYQYYSFINRYYNSGSILEKKFQLISTEFKGVSQRYLCFLLLKNPAYFNSTIYSTASHRFIQEMDDKYSRYLKNETTSLPTKGKDMLVDLNGVSITWDELLNKHRNKVIYVDFWASWCVPCRKAMPASKARYEELSYKNISFVYISTDESVNLWKNAVREDGMQLKEHYIVNLKTFSRFQVSSLPCYMIVDTHGNIVESHAVGPEDHRLKEQLMKLAEAK